MSIDAKQLRLGNKIKSIATGEYVEVDAFWFHELYDHHRNDDYSYEDWYSPVVLTPDILEKCGFEICDGETWFPYWQIKNTRPNELVEFVFKISTIGENDWRWLEGNANIPIYSFHELQNLYYSLTGEELNINL